TFQDGTSNTILFGEVYGACQNSGGLDFSNLWADPGVSDNTPYFKHDPPDWGAGGGRAGGGCIGPNCKFQIQPISNTPNGTGDNDLAQTPHTGGMQVCLGDASVRALNSGMSGTTFYFACTPAGGESLGSDWTQ